MNSSSSHGYRYLSLVYDRWQRSYGRDYSSIILPRLRATLRKYRLRRSTMLDLACGTGSLAFKMARRGWKVTGADASIGMLADARRKRGERGLPVRLLHQRMEELHLRNRVALVTCFFDSLNHLPSLRALDRTFGAVNASLETGGYFMFDVNNDRCFRKLWTLTDTFRQNDFLLILQNSYRVRARIATCRVTLFLYRNGMLRHYRETVRERCFSNDEIGSSLERNGFAVREREDFNFTAVPEVGKIKTWWVAQKVRDMRPNARSDSGRPRTPGRAAKR